MAYHDVVLSSRIRLARNYKDLPFDLSDKPEQAAECVTRTANALSRDDAAGAFHLYRLNEVDETQRQCMLEDHVISKDLLRTPNTSAVLRREDDQISVMLCEDDHLRIQAIRRGLDLQSAANSCFLIDEIISRETSLAFDPQWGYLTSCPTDTGTGMRATLLLHLPMLTRSKQIGNVSQFVAKVGLNIRGVYGEGSEALGDVYQVSNQITLGKSEEDLISTLTAVGVQLNDMELSQRQATLSEQKYQLKDEIYRSAGILLYAQILPLREFYHQWSYFRLGAAMGYFHVTTEQLDGLLIDCMPWHLRAWGDMPKDAPMLDVARATRVRSYLTSHGFRSAAD